MVMNSRSLKRVVKRRVTADLNDFLTFPTAEDIVSPAPAAPFRDCVREFLAKNAIMPPPSSLFPHLLAFQVLLRVGDLSGDDGGPAVVRLDVVEEDVACSRSVYCDQCRVVGWSSNPVCKKRYHFIIRAEESSIASYNMACAGCGDDLQFADSRCKSCSHMMTMEDVEDWIYSQLECTTHLLHGIIHSNGFGHLLRVNGREGGSKLLSGVHIMSFWDRLCGFLAVRKISVMDVSKKHGLDFRLLHAVVKGHPWYGDWGYQFCRGSYGLTPHDYKLAVDSLAFLPLSLFQSQCRKPRSELQDLIVFYQSISESELVNIRDLFSFLMRLIHDGQQSHHMSSDSPCKKQRTSSSSALCSWTISEIRCVEEAMFKVLRAVSESTWVSWRSLRGAVCKVGPPELLDYCLKELRGKQAAPGRVVNARCTANSGVMEYRLEPGTPHVRTDTSLNSISITNLPSKECLSRDLKYFYECMLHPETMAIHLPPSKRDFVCSLTAKILDCKQFVKVCNPDDTLPVQKQDMIQLFCEVELTEQTEESEEPNPNPPPELISLSSDATILDLKLEATRAFQDVYLMFKRFQAETLVGYGGVDESTQIKLLLGSAESVRIRGRFLGKNLVNRFRAERGMERWTVDCFCQARDDDGERMLSCDACGIWQHTRCSGISDSDAVPARFLCRRCSFLPQTICIDEGCEDDFGTQFETGDDDGLIDNQLSYSLL